MLLLTHTKKLLLVTFCDPTAETGVSFRTHGRKRNGWTDRHDSWNSYLDELRRKLMPIQSYVRLFGIMMRNFWIKSFVENMKFLDSEVTFMITNQFLRCLILNFGLVCSKSPIVDKLQEFLNLEFQLPMRQLEFQFLSIRI